MPLDLQAFYDESPFDRVLGLRIERSGEVVVVRGTLGHNLAVDSAGSFVHGGAVASVLDVALTFALIARTEHDWVTVDLRVDYLRPAPLGAIEARAEVLQTGRNIGRTRGELRDYDCATPSRKTIDHLQSAFKVSAPRTHRRPHLPAPPERT